MIERIVTPPLGANAYLILDKKTALIDVGGDFRFIYDAISRHADPESLDYIILTHTHFDHASATADLKKVTGAEVVIHSREYEFAREQNFSASFFGIHFPPFEPDVLVEEGDVLKLGKLELRVIHTPGHTPGSICLYDRQESLIFTGDTVFPNGGFGRVDFPGGNAIQLLNSLRRLTEIEVEWMYPGHDEPVRNARDHISTAYRLARMFL
ncbi:Zn-dependent hydrolase [Geoglobus ahangari]|uniref:Zn-dependent hydrolase n=1 Tax=Geoglobus ahangari TaxID=113653 RepID=A0A0F7IDX4_9EURY|nr:MBL fold metallo-hydrolase [Geoglobus ahangari]AKG91720.1 Zn-dependent hydrolase [Geoglobus ahangari]